MTALIELSVWSRRFRLSWPWPVMTLLVVQGFAYTSARMKTQYHFSQRYGRFEFRARLPAGTGFWPALWLMPEQSIYGGWPASGEIDVMENKGSDPPRVQGTLHYEGSLGQHLQATGDYYFPPPQRATDFHVYALQWTTNSIEWLVDGQVYETQSDGLSTNWVDLPTAGSQWIAVPANASAFYRLLSP